MTVFRCPWQASSGRRGSSFTSSMRPASHGCRNLGPKSLNNLTHSQKLVCLRTSTWGPTPAEQEESAREGLDPSRPVPLFTDACSIQAFGAGRVGHAPGPRTRGYESIVTSPVPHHPQAGRDGRGVRGSDGEMGAFLEV